MPLKSERGKEKLKFDTLFVGYTYVYNPKKKKKKKIISEFPRTTTSRAHF